MVSAVTAGRKINTGKTGLAFVYQYVLSVETAAEFCRPGRKDGVSKCPDISESVLWQSLTFLSFQFRQAAF